LEGECHRTAGDAELAAGHFEDALQHHRIAQELLQLGENTARDRVMDALLAQIRRLYADSNDPADVSELITRALAMEPRCAEVLFWQGLCHIRDGQHDKALASLEAAREADGGRSFDPSFFEGALLLRLGRAHDALPFLLRVHATDADSPLVTLHLGLCLLAMGGDVALAARNLAHAVGPEGLPRWVDDPDRLWREATPDESRSFVRRLAARHAFRCSVVGDDIATILRQARFALARAYHRLARFAEAASIFNELLQERAPTPGVLRGLGLALARLENYDQAFIHLRSAHERSGGNDPLIGATLALCAARGRPPRAEDRPKNVAWAVRLLAQGQVAAADAREWGLAAIGVIAEARLLGIAVPQALLQSVVQVLVDQRIVEPDTVDVIDLWATSTPESLQPEHAWLYAISSAIHARCGQRDLDIFALMFRDVEAARAAFLERDWDFDLVHYAYLARWADGYAGRLPDGIQSTAIGGESRFLLDRSQQLEESGELDAALKVADVWSRLVPREPAALDRLACLSIRAGDVVRSAAALDRWIGIAPTNPLPMVRRAMVAAQVGEAPLGMRLIEQAISLTTGRARADVAFTGSKIALKAGDEAGLRQAVAWLDLCLELAPGHAEAMWRLACVRLQLGDTAALAAQATAMDAIEALDSDNRFRYWAAVCHLYARNYARVIATAPCYAADAALALASEFLVGRAYAALGNRQAAGDHLRRVAASVSPAADLARALLGSQCYSDRDFDGAAAWWADVSAENCTTWQLERAQSQALRLSGLTAYHAGLFAEALERFRGMYGLAPAESAELLIASLIREGERIIFHVDNNGTTDAAPLLQDVVNLGRPSNQLYYLLGLAHKRQGRWSEARAAFASIEPTDANVLIQMGLLSRREGQSSQAEQEFAAAWQLDPASRAACHNLLLMRLQRGQLATVDELLSRFLALSADSEALPALRHLHQLIQESDQLPQMTSVDETQVLRLLRGLGHLDSMETLLGRLLVARPESGAVAEALVEVRLLRAWKLLGRADWAAAEGVLLPYTRSKVAASQSTIVAMYNLLGCCACLTLNFKSGLAHFHHSLAQAPQEPRLQQNMALAHEWNNQWALAEPHWDQFCSLINERLPVPPEIHDYRARLAAECWQRRAQHYADRHLWLSAANHAERASQQMPSDAQTAERLLDYQMRAGQRSEARATLERLRGLKPNDPRHELIAIDLQDVQTVSQLNERIDRLQKALSHCSNGASNGEGELAVGTTVMLLSQWVEHLTEQLRRIRYQVRRSPGYKVDWTVIRFSVRELQRDIGQLRNAVERCRLLTVGEQTQVLNGLSDQLDEDLAVCRRLGA
jgi:tetratricopeptide (TPR) repeat protein